MIPGWNSNVYLLCYLWEHFQVQLPNVILMLIFFSWTDGFYPVYAHDSTLWRDVVVSIDMVEIEVFRGGDKALDID